ncbi:hypothetical protein EJB05_30424, partial [Eragrostis curvula]
MDSSSETTPSTAWALLLEASGDSESDDLEAAASIIDNADDGDAESCSGGDDEDDGVGVSSRLVSWGCWMVEMSAGVVVVGAEGACPPSPEEPARDAEGDRLFWEACIAHGY